SSTSSKKRKRPRSSTARSVPALRNTSLPRSSCRSANRRCSTVTYACRRLVASRTAAWMVSWSSRPISATPCLLLLHAGAERIAALFGELVHRGDLRLRDLLDVYARDAHALAVDLQHQLRRRGGTLREHLLEQRHDEFHG